MSDFEALLPLPDVRARVGLSTSAIYERMSAGTFPLPTKEGTRSLWVASEVEAWVQARIAARNMGTVAGRKPKRTKKPLRSVA